jgi:hypothetical protein
VRKRYIDPAPPGKPFLGNDGLNRRFIPARLKDNPYLYSDGRYQRMLESLPEVQRKQLLEGNWDIAEGMAFPDFNKDDHVISPFDIPNAWSRLKSCDYGYTAPSCVLWAAVDPSDGTVIIYRELYEKQLTGEDLGAKIVEAELDELRAVPGVIDYSVFSRTGYTGPTIGEKLNRPPFNLKFRPADKNRKTGKVQIHQLLKDNPTTGRPYLQIFSSCTNIVRQMLSLQLSKNDVEDVDTNQEDHAYDALRYLVMSRPRKDTMQDRLLQMKKEVYFTLDNTFGY